MDDSFTSPRGLSRRLKDMDKQVAKMEKQIEKKYQQIEDSMTLDQMTGAQKPRVDTENTFWRDLLASDVVQETIAATKVIGIGSTAAGGFAFVHKKVGENLTEDQKIAVVHSLEKSHVIIEQLNNHCDTFDYWKT